MSESKKVDAVDTTLVRQLADILKETELTEIEVERGDLMIEGAREITVAGAGLTYAAAAAPVAQTAPAGAGAPPGL
ncbi:MAG: acetyl-CoA carboxylase, biotin carboxyl carrier protein, partial [Brevundimonas sp.]